MVSLLLCVEFEWAIITDCKKYLRECEITNLVARADHAHFVAVQCTKWRWSARMVKNLGGHVTLSTLPFRKICYRATAYMQSVLYAIARLSVCASVCHTGGSVKNG